MSGVSDVKPVEKVTAVGLEVAPDGTSAGGVAAVYVEPTQMRRPWQATIRTAFQALLALCTLLPLILANVYDSPDAYPAVVAQVLVFAGIFSRIMAMPSVEQFLQDYLPFLAAAPPPRGEHEAGVTTLEVCAMVCATVAVVFLIAWFTGSFNPGGR